MRILNATLLAALLTLVVGCESRHQPLRSVLFSDAGVSVVLFDEGLKLSTRHLRIDVVNERDTVVDLALAIRFVSQPDNTAGVTLVLGPSGTTFDLAPEPGGALPYPASSRDLGHLRLLPGQVQVLYINTGLPGTLVHEDVRVAWQSESRSATL